MTGDRISRRIELLLDEADNAIASGDWELALEKSRDVLAFDPENAEAEAFAAAAERRLSNGDSEKRSPESTVSSTADATDHADLPAIPSRDEIPESFANGRYQVKKFLGEGGKKLVYLALDTVLDREIAFSLIKAEGLDDQARQRVTREAQAMARLGDHPHLMPVFDMGLEKGLPFLVQPYMAGGDVEGLLQEAENGKLPLARSVQIAREVLQGLEFAHGMNIVHRDLKPGNVWLTDDGTVRIGDFGLALSLDRSRLTRESMIVGTVSYMPPEQATGGEVTPKADLYSLGAMLYEMVTGRPPFIADDEIAIISQHVNTPPVAPAWHNREIPAQLDALIMRLLAKDPAARPNSATDALAALDDIDLAAAAAGSAGSDDVDSGSLESMAGGVFVGRHQEMDQLKSILERALAGRGGMVTLAGEPGVGKTRVAQELETYAGLRNAQVLWGRCYQESGAPPYWPWVQAIRSYVRQREPEDLRNELGSTAGVISEIVPDVKERLPDVQEPQALDDPNSARFRLFDSMATFLKAASSVKPLIIILDDLHWADQPSLMFLEFLAKELSSSRILIVGTYRDMELGRRHPLSITLGDLSKERLFERVVLRGISKEDVRRFIELAAGIDPPSGLVDSVYAQTEGNPLFVTEIIRLFIQEGDLDPEKLVSTDSWTMRTPEGVREAIGRRLDRLSESANEVLATAAIIGREFTLAQLSAVLEKFSDDSLLDVLDETLAARVVEELPVEVGRYRFSHALIQQTLSDELSTTRKVRLHARIAEALEQLWGSESQLHAAELAHHFIEAESLGVSGKLAEYALLAGEEAISRAAYQDAARYFESAFSALDGGVNDGRKARILFGLARAGVVLADGAARQAAMDQMAEAFDSYEAIGDIPSAIKVAQEPVDILQLTGVTELAKRGLRLAEPGSLDEGWLLSRYGTALHAERGEFELAHEALNTALAISKQHNDLGLEARITTNLTQRLSAHDELAAAIKHGERAEELISSLGDRVSEIRIGTFLANAYLGVGDVGGAERVISKLSSAAESLNAASYRSYGWGLQARLATLCGDWARVADIAKEAAAGTEAGWQSGIALEEARILFEKGDSEGAELKFSSKIGDGVNWREPAAAASIAWVAHRATGQDMLERVKDLINRGAGSADKYRSRARSSQTVLAMIAVEEADSESADRLYADLVGRDGGMDPTTGISTGHILGLLASFMGRSSDASAHLESGIEFCRSAGYRPELAWTCADYAGFLLERRESDDPERAHTFQDEALAIAQELGMRSLLERVLAQRDILKA